MKYKYTRNCVTCFESFETNYHAKISCSEECREERKRVQKLEAYNAKKEAPRKVYRNSFLRRDSHR